MSRYLSWAVLLLAASSPGRGEAAPTPATSYAIEVFSNAVTSPGHIVRGNGGEFGYELYVTTSTSIVKVKGDGTSTVFAADLKAPTGLVFPPADSVFGNYLYATEQDPNNANYFQVIRFNPNGMREVFAAASKFSNTLYDATKIGFGPAGTAYAGLMYIADGGFCGCEPGQIWEVKPDASARTLLVDNGSTMSDIEFTLSSSVFGEAAFVSETANHGSDDGGIFKMSTAGARSNVYLSSSTVFIDPGYLLSSPSAQFGSGMLASDWTTRTLYHFGSNLNLTSLASGFAGGSYRAMDLAADLAGMCVFITDPGVDTIYALRWAGVGDTDGDGIQDAQESCLDKDGDGYGGNSDPDDNNGDTYPGATEVCDGQDNDQDGITDEGFDADEDGFSTCDQDCDDTNGDVNPEADESCNAIDDNCDGNIDEGVTASWYEDGDGDGVGNSDVVVEACEAPSGYVPGGGDPDDTDGTVYPGAPELCDGLDNDGDGTVDEGVQITAYTDGDQDSFGDINTATEVCSLGSDQTTDALDCDDTNPNINPSAPETCDGNDNDCDGQVDEGVLLTVYSDGDGDGYGDPQSGTPACGPGQEQSAIGGDCDDTTASTYPGAEEIPYDGVDNNCDGSDLTDVDGDHFDGAQAGGTDCNDEDAGAYPGATEIPYDGIDQDCSGDDLTDVDEDGFDGTQVEGEDCADEDPNTYPGAPEFADGTDNNCNGSIDEGLDTTDDDGDGFSEAQGDCNDNQADIHPDLVEVCNAIDDNCNSDVDEGFDGDQDAHQDDDTCPDGLGDDCDDANSDVYPGAPEEADGVDNNCDGIVDEGTDVFDDDGDGVSEEEGDCNDANPDIFPQAEEILDGLDNNCDGVVDSSPEQDADGDGYTVSQGDCDDEEDEVHPGAEEVEDGLDNNCDGQIDEGFDTSPTPPDTDAPSLTPTPFPTFEDTKTPETPTATPLPETDTPPVPSEPPSPPPQFTPTPAGDTGTPDVVSHGGGCGCDNQNGMDSSWLALVLVGLLKLRRRS